MNSSNKGFTLIETLVAIAVISMVLTAFVNLALGSMRGKDTAELRYTAAKIAEEGIELVINKKDNHVLCVQEGGGTCPPIGSNWQADLIGTWQVDATKDSQFLATGNFQTFNSNDFVCLENSGLFSYCASPDKRLPGNFTRRVVVQSLGSENIKITSIVNWDDRENNKQLILEEVVFGLP